MRRFRLGTVMKIIVILVLMTMMMVVMMMTVFAGTAHRKGEYGCGVAIAVAVILKLAPVATCPDKY